MASIRVGFIGTGKRKAQPDLNGFFMAYHHAPGYAKLPDCDMVCCADIVREHAEEFAQAMGVPAVYTDYHEMLAKEGLDIVSICTWPHLHAEMTIACVEAGVPAVHCEKPMALTFGECKAMLAAAEKHGTKLTFNHQRRFGAPFRNTAKLIQEGAVGELVRMEAHVGDLYDGGVHWVDMLNYFNGETPAEWVIGQIDCRSVRVAFGAPSEYQAICHVKYRNGVAGLVITGESAQELGPAFRVLGTEGMIEIGWGRDPGPMLRVSRRGASDWSAVDCGNEDLHGPGYIDRAIADIVDCFRTGRESELCVRNEMNAMEIVFGCYESSRRRARVDMPLDIDDSPLISMLESGEVG